MGRLRQEEGEKVRKKVFFRKAERFREKVGWVREGVGGGGGREVGGWRGGGGVTGR